MFAVILGHRRQQIQTNEFHVRISWWLADRKKSPLPLVAFNPNKRLPRSEDLPEAEAEERAAKVAVLEKYWVKSLRKHVHTIVDFTKDPWVILLAKLCRISVPPKACQGYQQFMCEDFTEKIELTLPDDVQEEYWVHAKEEATTACAAYERTLKEAPSKMLQACYKSSYWEKNDRRYRGIGGIGTDVEDPATWGR
ncbi:hypothetical protein C8R43DRAFT_951597 [Mycena crocata]|nr:hypothetical protein C8R43DRAFT_951597 [Mycena crocata]